MTVPTLSPRTREELAQPAPPGHRHGQIVRLAVALLGQGLCSSATFHQLRGNYAADIPDREIWSAVRWADSRKSSGGSSVRHRPGYSGRPVCRKSPKEFASDFLKGFQADEADLWELSPVRLSDDWTQDGRLLVETLFHPSECVNVVTDSRIADGKASPSGKGISLSAAEWSGRFPDIAGREYPGAWIRMNPTDGQGIADANVSAVRFCLLEFDEFPESVQLSLFARLPVPISAVLTSGGKSVHAWVRLNAETPEAFRETVSRIFRKLEPLGIDPANKNPGRLSRLPGITRTVGASGDGRQRLLYLNPSEQPSFPIL
jgi:hypothetical protein